MTKRLGLLLGMLMTQVCSAAEIVAWKVPLSRFAGNGLETEGIRRCQAAPEHSPFFKEGDELWNLKELTTEERIHKKLPLEWIVWNANAGRVVAKAKWDGIWQLNEILRPDSLPRHCRLTTSLYEVAANGAPMSEDAMPGAELSMVAKSMYKSEASWSRNGKTIKVEGEMAVSEDNTSVDVRFLCSAEVTGQAAIEVNTGFLLQSGMALWVARDFDGTKGLDLKVCAVIESLDCTLFRERVMLQKEEQIVPLVPEWLNPRTHPVGKRGWLASGWISPRDLMGFLAPDSAVEGADPFAVSAQEVRAVLPPVSAVSAPEFLRPWLDHEVLDAREWFEKIAPDCMGVDNFIGYDPICERLYFYSSKQASADDFWQIFTGYDGGCRPLIITTLDGYGQARLVCNSGEKASLSRTGNAKSAQRSIKIEPTVGETGELIDMRLDYRDDPDPQRATHLKTQVTLNEGKPLELFARTEDDKEKSSLRMKAEVSREFRGGGE